MDIQGELQILHPVMDVDVHRLTDRQMDEMRRPVLEVATQTFARLYEEKGGVLTQGSEIWDRPTEPTTETCRTSRVTTPSLPVTIDGEDMGIEVFMCRTISEVFGQDVDIPEEIDWEDATYEILVRSEKGEGYLYMNRAEDSFQEEHPIANRLLYENWLSEVSTLLEGINGDLKPTE